MSGAAFGLPLHSFHFQKNKKLYVFESDILHILLADSIISTAKRFREMKKLQFLKAGDYMKTITRAKYLDRIIELNGTPDIKIIMCSILLIQRIRMSLQRISTSILCTIRF